MVLIICTKNETNLTNRYWDMVPAGQKMRRDGMDGRRQNYIHQTMLGDKKNKNEILLSKKVSYDSFIKKKWLTTMI